MKKILFEFKDKVSSNKFKITNQNAMCLLHLDTFMLFFRKNSTVNVSSSHDVLDGPIIIELYSNKFEIINYTLGNMKDDQFYVQFSLSKDSLFPLFSLGKTYEDNFTISVNYNQDKIPSPPQLFGYVNYISRDAFTKMLSERHIFKIIHQVKFEDVADRLSLKIENPRHIDNVNKIIWRTKNKYDTCVVETRNTIITVPFILSLQSRNYHEYEINNVINDIHLIKIKFYDYEGNDITNVVLPQIHFVFEDNLEFRNSIPDEREASDLILH